MMIKKPTDKTFGKRLAMLRKQSGLTTQQLASRIGASLRSVHYYEKQSKFPPAHLLPKLANELNVTIEEMLGVKPTKTTFDPKQASLWRNLKKAQHLSKKDQRILIDLINSLVAKTRNSA